jgi:hypothetical protein
MSAKACRLISQRMKPFWANHRTSSKTPPPKKASVKSA